MRTKPQYYSNLAIPPGEYLEEVIAELGISKDELARRMNRPAAKLSAIYKGEKAITPETALQLEKVLGVPAHIWIGLESEYRLTLARQSESKQDSDKQAELVTKFCYPDLVRHGFVEQRTRREDKVEELQKFFGVTSLQTIPSLNRYQPFFRTGKRKSAKRSPEALSAWLRMGELRARELECNEFQKEKLFSALPHLCLLTKEEPENFLPGLKTSLATAGIAFVVVPHLPKTYANGATYWIGKNKAILMVTLRGSWADIFWFSLFHEIGHIVLHSQHIVFVEEEGEENDSMDQHEQEADQFAADMLIPPHEYELFVQNGEFYPGDIKHFADKIGIDVGIVVGRLQHDHYLENNWHNDLRTRYKWSDY